jgi:CHASE3 domain sensor protein
MLKGIAATKDYRREGARTMAANVTLTEAEVRAFSSLLTRVSERLSTYEEQTHQDRRHAEELQAAAEDLLSRLREGSPVG